MAERKRATIPITGIDTSTPNHSVEDGKCETLHNLRYTGEAWRNVKEFEGKDMPILDDYDIIYKHPATPENEYIVVNKSTQSDTSSTLYAYLSEDNQLYYTPSPLSDNNVIGKLLYDSQFQSLGIIIDIEEYDNGEASASICTAPSLDTFRVYGFQVEGRDQDSPDIRQLYFPEGTPTIGSIAMQYGANGQAEFSCYGYIEDYDGNSVYLSHLNEQDVVPADIYSFAIGSKIDINVLDTHSTMFAIEDKDKSLYLSCSDYTSNVDNVVYVKVADEFKLGFMVNVEEVPNGHEFRYYVMDDYYSGIQTFYYPYSKHSKEVRWFDAFSFNRYPEGDKTDAIYYHSLFSALITKYELSIKQEICRIPEVYNVSHFGNMLLVKHPNEHKTNYFLLDNGKYRPYADNLSLKFSTSNITKSAVAPTKVETRASDNIVGMSFYTIETWEPVADSIDTLVPLSTTQGDSFRGEFAIFAALRSENGTILYRTPVQIYNGIGLDGNLEIGETPNFSSAKDKYGVTNFLAVEKATYDLYNSFDEEQRKTFCPNASKFYKVKVDFEGSWDNVDVYDITFYSTRLYPLTVGYNINDVDLIQEPFYALHTIKKTDVVADDLSFTIDSIMIGNVEHSPLYVAAQSINIYSDRGFEYNNRLHLLGVNTSTSGILADTLKTTNVHSVGNQYLSTAILKSNYEGKELQYTFPAVMFSDNDLALSYAETQPFLLTFGGKVAELLFADNNLEYSNRLALKYSTALDISYLTNLSSSNMRKYQPLTLNKEKIGELEPTSEYAYSPNRLQVSELNNPYVYPFENSYRIGSATNEIIAINSAAIEMSDAKFGEFPVYVFTKEGIFAMQSGTETLYAAIVPINYDVAINPNTLAVNGAVLYFTDKGLHALTNQGAQLLSAPLHTSNNRIPEWMRTTQMVYLPEWNEVLCTDLPNRKAYVFSLDSKVWSTRDIPEGYILNNDELVATDDMIYNLRNEKEQGEKSIAVTISTRPIKLGSIELKRAETIIVRFECATEQTLNVKVEGSVDTQHWQTLRELENVKTNKDIIIRRTPASVKYLRFSIRGEVTDDIRILAFEVEYYHRWMRKMR